MLGFYLTSAEIQELTGATCLEIWEATAAEILIRPDDGSLRGFRSPVGDIAYRTLRELAGKLRGYEHRESLLIEARLVPPRPHVSVRHSFVEGS